MNYDISSLSNDIYMTKITAKPELIKKIPLSQLQEGMYAIVVDMKNNGAIRRRLRDIGLIEGTEIECVKRSPLGNPVAFLIRGAVIAIRNEDSCDISVEIKI